MSLALLDSLLQTLPVLGFISFRLTTCLLLGGILFVIGAFGVIARRNILIVLISIELMLNAVNLVLASFARMHASFAVETLAALNTPEGLAVLNRQEIIARVAYNGETGHILALFIIAVAAAEAAVGLAIVITYFRNRETVDTRDMRIMSQ